MKNLPVINKFKQGNNYICIIKSEKINACCNNIIQNIKLSKDSDTVNALCQRTLKKIRTLNNFFKVRNFL